MMLSILKAFKKFAFIDKHEHFSRRELKGSFERLEKKIDKSLIV